MLIRSFFNAKGDPYYVLGFENETERTRMFEALNQSDVFLTPLGKRMEFSDLVRQLEQRDTSHLAMKGASIAMPDVAARVRHGDYSGFETAASIFHGGAALGYIVIGLLAFLLGVCVTVLCFRLRQMSREDGQDKESEDAHGAD